jgi:PAS domain S-box-containing protein
VVALIAGALIPWIGNLLYLFNLSPWPGLDLTPIALALTGLVLAWSLFRFQLLDLMPMAREVVFDSMGDGVIILDDRRRVVDLNPRARHWLRAGDEAIGRSVFDVVPLREDVLKHEDLAERQIELKIDTRQGLRAYELTLSPLRDDRKGLRGWVVLVHDITDRKQAEEAIRQLNTDLERRVEVRTAELHQANAALTQALKVKNDFLAVMSHELRTPLTAVLGLAETLQLDIAGSLTEKQRQWLQAIQSSGQHLLDLITDALEFVSVDAGRLQLVIGPVAVDELCETSLQQIQTAAQKKELRVTVNHDASVKMVWGDSRRLTKVLITLLDNAVKFTPAGGTIGLEVRRDAARQETQFSVWDTGIGITPADQGRLFEPFVQVDSRPERQYEGTGMGLALVKRLAKVHGGRVTVESEGVPGKGSRFTVYLPGMKDGAAA